MSEAQVTAALRAVSVFYGEVVGLSQLTLELKAGITGLVGPNGSGKSTLMRVLTGLLAPQEGSVAVLGGDPFREESIRARTAFVPATEAFFRELSGKRNLEAAFLMRGLSLADARRATDRALELSGLTDASRRAYGAWSRGMRQRLKLGLALASDAQLVLLDEPFLGVDPPSRRDLRDLIVKLGESGRTVLVSSHVLHEIESLTDQVGVLARGRLLGFGRIDALLLELRDRHPHRIAIDLDEPRRLAGALLALSHVREVAVTGDTGLEFVTDEPSLAYREVTAMIGRLGLVARRVQTVDGNLEAVFHHVTAAGARRL
ncbi:MAG: ABC transporter ATP-binding protein [Candidatus Eisenbacteria bacterium]